MIKIESSFEQEIKSEIIDFWKPMKTTPSVEIMNYNSVYYVNVYVPVAFYKAINDFEDYMFSYEYENYKCVDALDRKEYSDDYYPNASVDYTITFVFDTEDMYDLNLERNLFI